MIDISHSRAVFFMEHALEEAEKCLESRDVPIGCVIVKNDEIIARGRNRIVEKRIPTAHAEIEAIEKAAKYTGYERLNDTAIFVTLEPCAMCSGAIVLARIPVMFYAASDPKTGASGSLYNITNDERLNHKCIINSGLLKDKSSELIRNFFRNLRKSK